MSLYTSLKTYKVSLRNNIQSRGHHSSKKQQNQNNKSQQKTPRISCKSQTRNQQSKRLKTSYDLQLHDPENCVCLSCDCGQHKCQIQCNKPHLNKSTTYHNSFKNTTIKDLKKQEIVLFIPNKLPEKIIDLKTIYQQKFNSKPIYIQKPLKTPDHQRFQGPSLQVTTYQQKFPGYNGKNPHFKTKPQDFRGGLRFRGNSMYNSTYMSVNAQKAKSLKQSASLKTEGDWFGKSSYQQSFWGKNKKTLKSISYKPKIVYEKRPSSAYQFKSSYQTLYENPCTNKQIDKNCPAKKLLIDLTQNSHHKELKSERANRSEVRND